MFAPKAIAGRLFLSTANLLFLPAAFDIQQFFIFFQKIFSEKKLCSVKGPDARLRAMRSPEYLKKSGGFHCNTIAYSILNTCEIIAEILRSGGT